MPSLWIQGIAVVVGAVGQGVANNKAADQAKKAARMQEYNNIVQQNDQKVTNRDSRRRLNAQRRVAQASALQAGINSGVSGSSLQLSTLNSITSQVGQQFSDMARGQNLADMVSYMNMRTMNYSDKAQVWQNKGQTWSSLMGAVSAGAAGAAKANALSQQNSMAGFDIDIRSGNTWTPSNIADINTSNWAARAGSQVR